MKTFKINYLAPNKNNKTVHGRCPVLIHKVATYHCETEEEALAKFEKYHGKKYHQFQFIWEETGIDSVRINLAGKLLIG